MKRSLCLILNRNVEAAGSGEIVLSTKVWIRCTQCRGSHAEWWDPLEVHGRSRQIRMFIAEDLETWTVGLCRWYQSDVLTEEAWRRNVLLQGPQSVHCIACRLWGSWEMPSSPRIMLLTEAALLYFQLFVGIQKWEMARWSDPTAIRRRRDDLKWLKVLFNKHHAILGIWVLPRRAMIEVVLFVGSRVKSHSFLVKILQKKHSWSQNSRIRFAD